MRCPICGGWIDCRDVDRVLAHDGQLPHPQNVREQMSVDEQKGSGAAVAR